MATPPPSAPPAPADGFRRFLDALAEVRRLTDGADHAAPVQAALTRALEAHRQAVHSSHRPVPASDLVERYRALYTSALDFDLERPSRDYLRRALRAVVEALQADAGALVVLGADGHPERSIAIDARDEDILPVSESVINRVRAARGAVNIEDAARTDGLAAQASVVQSGARAVLCVPVLVSGDVWGAAYLDRRRPDAPFSRGDLAVLEAFVRQTGAALQLFDRFERLASETAALRDRVHGRIAVTELIGRSKPLLHLLEQIAAVADTDATVLITGESGTGKELIAKTLHSNSRHRDGPFVAVNCGAIPESLLESTLFGHKKGAFTGAVSDEGGLVEAARGGTLFLDEIGDMPLALQVKLLRVLQTGAYTRVGSTEQRQAQVRWVAATHRDVQAAIAEGVFREDLYYRLCVFDLHVPALRERAEDVPLLADHFLRRFAQQYGRPARQLSADALVALEGYAWPGNVRELENVLQRAVILAEGPTIKLQHLPHAVTGTAAREDDGAATRDYHDAVRLFKQRLLSRALDAADGSRTQAAQALGLNRTYLSRLLRQFELQDSDEEE